MTDFNFNVKLNLSCLNKDATQMGSRSVPKGDEAAKGGIFVKPLVKTAAQKDTIEKSLAELEKVRFNPLQVIYLKALGVRPPFKNGKDAVKFLKDKGAEITYAEFSNSDVHACLDTTKQTPTVLINSAYKDLASKTDIMAISEALLHEASHAKDCDNFNSIQEELDCLALNVLAHRYYKKNYGDVFENQTSPLYLEGVNLYEKLFFDKDPAKTALKKRVALKYGYLDTFSPGHPASRLAHKIEKCATT